MSELKLEGIAKKVGVSRSTVSGVVNDYHCASDDIRQRLFGITRNMDRRSDETVCALASQRFWIVGLELSVGVNSHLASHYVYFTQDVVRANCRYGFIPDPRWCGIPSKDEGLKSSRCDLTNWTWGKCLSPCRV